MEEDFQDDLVEDMLSIPPLFHRVVRRKLLKAAANIEESVSPPLLSIIKVLEDEGTLHIAEIGERLQIPRPQMTHLIDKLVDMEMASRQTDPADRRIINVTLTPTGAKALEEFKRTVKDSIKLDLAGFTSEEVQELSAALRKIRDMLSKFQ